jgi:hypothetical protein
VFSIAVRSSRKKYSDTRFAQAEASVRRSVTVQNIEKANDLIAGARAAWRIGRNGLSTLKIRVK